MNTAVVVLLSKAKQHGVSITPIGCTLKLRAERQPPDGLLAELRAHKAEILALLSSENWTDEHEERAGTAEFDSGIPRVWAEGLARLPSGTYRCPGPAMAAVHRRLRSVRRRMGIARFPARMDATCAVWMRPNQAIRSTRPAGLLWLVEGRRIVALTAETAAIEIPGGRQLTYRRKPHLEVESIAVWDVVSEG